MKKNDPYLSAGGTGQLVARIAELETAIKDNKFKLGQWRTNLNTREPIRKDLYTKAHGGYCANQYTLQNAGLGYKKAREECQVEINKQLAIRTAEVAKANAEIKKLEALILANETELSQAKTELDSYNIFVEEAAKTGLSPEDAHLLAQQKLSEQKAKAEEDQAKSKMIRNIIIGVAIVGVIAGGVIFYKKVKSKKSK